MSQKNEDSTAKERVTSLPSVKKSGGASNRLVRFSVNERQERLGGALGVSMIAHFGFYWIALLIFSMVPAQTAVSFDPNRNNYDIVWIPQEGYGGGGGGGGNESLEMPREALVMGEDEISVPVAPESVVEEIVEEVQQPPEQELILSALPMASGFETLPGILEPLPALSMESQGPGTGGGASSGQGIGIGSGEGAGVGGGSGGGSGGGVYRPGNNVLIPRVVREVKPGYTAEAMRAKIQGSVWLEAVVLPDGTVGDVHITKTLDPVFGLDAEAVKATKQWRFLPGTRFGEPVAVLVIIELTFSLR